MSRQSGRSSGDAYTAALLMVSPRGGPVRQGHGEMGIERHAAI